jgi:AraC-like DNA-binding protein
VAGSVSTLLVRPLVMAVGSANLAAFLAATDLTPQIVGDDDARISPSQFCIAWAELMRFTSPEIALSIARATPSGAFGLVEYVCRSSPTLGDALRQWVRYLNILSDAIDVGLAVEGDRVSVRVERESEAPAHGAHELCFALLAQQSKQLSTQPFRLISVEFAHRTTGNLASYRAWFDAPVRFGAERTQIVFPSAALDASLVSADPKLLAILMRAANEVAAKKPADATLASQVARIVGEALRNDESDVDRVAKRLGMTSRSLQRRLKDEGTSFNAVREDVRKELSRRYLADNLSIAEISFLLGFSEPSAFFRAFKRWTGTTPLEARRRGALAT